MSTKIPAAVVAVKGAFEDAQAAIQGVIDKIRSAIDDIREAIAAIRDFLGLSGPTSSSGGSGYVNPGQQAGGGGYVNPGQQAGGGGYGATHTRGMGGMVVNLTINAPGGNPRAVAQAAQTGMLAAARSMGLA